MVCGGAGGTGLPATGETLCPVLLMGCASGWGWRWGAGWHGLTHLADQRWAEQARPSLGEGRGFRAVQGVGASSIRDAH